MVPCKLLLTLLHNFNLWDAFSGLSAWSLIIDFHNVSLDNHSFHRIVMLTCLNDLQAVTSITEAINSVELIYCYFILLWVIAAVQIHEISLFMFLELGSKVIPILFWDQTLNKERTILPIYDVIIKRKCQPWLIYL